MLIAAKTNLPEQLPEEAKTGNLAYDLVQCPIHFNFQPCGVRLLGRD